MSSHVVDLQKWAHLSIFEQMGNIGSEVGRTFSALRRNDAKRADSAFRRGLDLLDATAVVWAAKRPERSKEVLRARDVFAEAVIRQQPDGKLEAYFMQFAIAGRLHR